MIIVNKLMMAWHVLHAKNNITCYGRIRGNRIKADEASGSVEKTVCVAGRSCSYFLLYKPISSVCTRMRPFMALTNADLVAFALRDSMALSA
jgi:hypothetical protein